MCRTRYWLGRYGVDRQHAVEAQGGPDTRRRVGQSSATLVIAIVHVSDGVQVLVAGVIWAALIMGLTHAAGWALDKRADRVVTR